MKYLKSELKHFNEVYKVFTSEYSTLRVARLKFWQYVMMYAETRMNLLRENQPSV